MSLLLNLFAGVNTPLIIGLTVLGLIVAIIVIIVAILPLSTLSHSDVARRLSVLKGVDKH